jgi:glutaredoxin-like protein NrdH
MPVIIYTLPNCVQCDTSKRMMKRLEIEFEEVDLSKDDAAAEMVKELGYTAAPVIINGGTHWSGFRMEMINGLKLPKQDPRVIS